MEIPIENVRERQPYDGAFTLLTGLTSLWEAAKGDMEHTVGFLTMTGYNAAMNVTF